MPNVLVRDVPADDLDQLRAAASARGTSLQGYLRDAVHAQAAYLRRQAALTRTTERLSTRPDVPTDERNAILQAIDDAHAERSERLSGQRAQ